MQTGFRWLMLAAAVLILVLNILFRFLWLDRLPGINGDEAYLAIQVAHFIRSEPFTLRTPTGMFISPFLLLSHWALLSLFDPNFFLLRLPAPVWSILGLVCYFLLHCRAYGSRQQAFWSTVLLSALPMHLAYSRIHWDASYMPMVAAWVLFPSIRIADGQARWPDVLLLACGAIFCLWVHLSSAVFLGLIALALLWVYRRTLMQRLSFKRAGGAPRPGFLLAGALALGVLGGCFIVILSGFSPRDMVQAVAAGAIHLLTHPVGALRYLLIIGQIAGGERAFQFFAGVEGSALLTVCSFMALIGLLAAVVVLIRSQRAGDRMLALIWLALPFVWVGSFAVFLLQIRGHDRYFLWLLPLAAVSYVRALTVFCEKRGWAVGKVVAPVSLGVSALLLVQFWIFYFKPLESVANAKWLHPAFHTGAVEPKAAAAKWIGNSAKDAARYDVYARDWYVAQPIRYLLEPKAVFQDKPQAEQALQAGRPLYIVGYTFSEQMREWESWGTQRRDFPAGNGRPLISVLYASPGS